MDLCIEELYTFAKRNALSSDRLCAGEDGPALDAALENFLAETGLSAQADPALFLELKDRMDRLEHDKCRCAFALGLDLGLSIGRELAPFQSGP